jgi:type I restriction enzyme, R subunit
MERDDFDQTPFSEKGGLGRFYEVFGEEMDRVIDELNEALAA